jgi:hypothetical protein
MAKTVTTREVYTALQQSLRSRPDLGFRKTVADGVLEPQNPFVRDASRRPQRWFVLTCVVATAAVGCFLYFNFWQ